MRKAFTLIEITLSIAIGLLIFQLLFSSNLLFTRIYTDSMQTSSQDMDQSNAFLYLYKHLSNASSEFTNNYEGRLNRGFFSFKDIQSNTNSFYLYSSGGYDRFSQNKFEDDKYYLMHFRGELNQETYGEGYKLLSGVNIHSTDWLMSYSMETISVHFYHEGKQVNYQLRVKN